MKLKIIRCLCVFLVGSAFVCFLIVIKGSLNKKNADLVFISNQFKTIKTDKVMSLKLETKNNSDWDLIVFCAAYSSYQEIAKKLRLDQKSESLLKKNLMTYETGQIYLVKRNEIMGFELVERLKIIPDGYIFLDKSNTVFCTYSGSPSAPIILSLIEFKGLRED